MISEEKFEFTAKAKKNIFITIGVGIVLLILGIVMLKSGGHHHEGTHEATKSAVHEGGQQPEVAVAQAAPAEHEHEGGHHDKPLWLKRLIKDVWQTNIFFTGIAVMGLFFVCFNYVAWAGWSAAIQRIPMAFGGYLFVSVVVTIAMIAFCGQDLFHWMHHGLTNELLENGKENPHFDEVIASKTWYLNTPFFWARTIVYFSLWLFFWWRIRANAAQEDINGGDSFWHKNTVLSACFLIVWGVTESMSSWDWVMSMDPHFYSTMFGWYVFASWFVSALAVITLAVLYLKDAGYLKMVNENHLHDLGKFMFAFSVFWTYIWFEQFLLIYYANIPEETLYFVTRLKTDAYMPLFFFSLIINFSFPFLGLMTRNAKRQGIMLKVIAIGILLGHWIDFYNMMTPPILKQDGGFGIEFFFLELGVVMVFVGLFLFTVLTALSRINLVPKNHPMLEESVHHHVF